MSLEFTNIASHLIGDTAVGTISGGIQIRAAQRYRWHTYSNFLVDNSFHTKLLVFIQESDDSMKITFAPLFYTNNGNSYVLWNDGSHPSTKCLTQRVSGGGGGGVSTMYGNTNTRVEFRLHKGSVIGDRYDTDISLSKEFSIPKAGNSIITFSSNNDEVYWLEHGVFTFGVLFNPHIEYELPKEDADVNYSLTNISYRLQFSDYSKSNYYNIVDVAAQSDTINFTIPALENTPALYTKVDGMWLPCRMLVKQNGEWISSSN